MEFAKHFDVDGTKTISYMEFVALLESIGSPATEKQIQDLFSKGPLNKENSMTFEDFAKLMSFSESNQQEMLKVVVPAEAKDLVWYVVSKLHENTSIGNIMIERGFYGKVEHGRQSDQDKIIVHDRLSGKLVEEKIPEYIKVAMKLMYTSGAGRFAVDRGQIKKVLKHMSVEQGKKYETPHSASHIRDFIAYYSLNVEEIKDPLESFKNFNQFFYRKLKADARKIEGNDSKIAVSGADARLNVFETVDEATKIWIKGKNFSLKNLLCDEALAAEFTGGSLVIFRLAPQDYHRFHCPVDGKVIKMRPHDGTYYTVNPFAINQNVDVYTENKRCVVDLQSPQFGHLIYITIGATLVGSIAFTVKEGQSVKRGDELGFFAFGGSTVILLFKKGAIKYDHDLLVNSAKPIETLVSMGNRIGQVP